MISVSQATRPERVVGEDGVEDRVRDLVGHLVGMALGHRLRGEEERAVSHIGREGYRTATNPLTDRTDPVDRRRRAIAGVPSRCGLSSGSGFAPASVFASSEQRRAGRRRRRSRPSRRAGRPPRRPSCHDLRVGEARPLRTRPRIPLGGVRDDDLSVEDAVVDDRLRRPSSFVASTPCDARGARAASARSRAGKRRSRSSTWPAPSSSSTLTTSVYSGASDSGRT